MIDLFALLKLRHQPDGRIIAQCPACFESGSDKKGNHLTIWPSGRWSCCVYPGDKLHNRRIFALCGGEVEGTEPVPPLPKRSKTALDWMGLIMEWAGQTPERALGAFAASLGVSADALATLNAVWTDQHRAWAFPMRDSTGKAIGIRLRAMDGRKWAIRGSQNGIFLPEVAPQSIVFVCEGPTDTAACLTLGVFAIGRPSCNCGGPEIRAACKRLEVRRAVIVADHDDPGQVGARKIARELKMKTVIWTPPGKDIRDWVRLGGTRQVLESEIKNLVWKG